MRVRISLRIDLLGKPLNWRAFLICFLLVGLTLVAPAGFGTTAEVNIQAAVVGQYGTVRAHYPDAKLFQVFVHNLVPEPNSSEQKPSLEIHSYFGIGTTERFLEVISRDSKEYQEVVRPFAGNDCFHGHPASRSEACLPSVQMPATQDEYLSLDWDLDPARLATAFRKCGLDPSKPFDISIVSAKRAVSSWKWADVQQASTLRDRLSEQHPDEIVISATESSASGQSMGPTRLFRRTDYESLGNLVLFRPKSKLPPSR
jgi:hypothetical protein